MVVDNFAYIMSIHTSMYVCMLVTHLWCVTVREGQQLRSLYIPEHILLVHLHAAVFSCTCCCRQQSEVVRQWSLTQLNSTTSLSLLALYICSLHVQSLVAPIRPWRRQLRIVSLAFITCTKATAECRCVRCSLTVLLLLGHTRSA